jgi:hypothetical protein
VLQQRHAGDRGADAKAAIGGWLDRVISAIFLMSTITPGFSTPDRICTSKSVPPARMRAALPLIANAPIASSSVSGARYRSSVMVFPPISRLSARPIWAMALSGPAVAQAYTAGAVGTACEIG